jgi:hypothetical protein
MENYNILINPALKKSNFNGLSKASSIGWPFKQESIELESETVSESVYYLSWKSPLDEISDFYRREGLRLEVTITRNNENVSFEYLPFFDEEGNLLIYEDYFLVVLDEDGSRLPDKTVEMDLLRELGDLKTFSDSNWDFVTKDGVLQLRSVDPGDYLYRLYAYGRSSYSYSTLRLKGTGKISFVQGEVIPDFVVARTGDAFLESVKIRGLMDEFVSNKIAVNESKEFAEKSLKWIDAVASDGLNLREMEALKRVYVSVGAFLNGMAYAAIESERVESDLLQMVRDTRSMTRKAGYRLQGMGSREENRQSIQVSMQLRKLSRHDFLKLPHFVIPNSFRDPGLILSEDGGPLTDNVAFSSDQRVFVLKRAAALRRGC